MITLAICYLMPGLLLALALTIRGLPDRAWKFPAVVFVWPVLLWMAWRRTL